MYYKPSFTRIKHDSIFLDTTGGIYKHLFEWSNCVLTVTDKMYQDLRVM